MSKSKVFAVTMAVSLAILWYGGADLFSRSAQNAWMVLGCIYISFMASMFID